MIELLIERIENLNLAIAVVAIVLGGIALYLVVWIKELSRAVHNLEEKLEGIEFEKSMKGIL